MRANSNSIPQWKSLDTPPPIIGLGEPCLNRRKDPQENQKKVGRLSRHGMEMTYGICKVKGHKK